MQEQRRKLFDGSTPHILFHHKDHAVIYAPCDKVPCRPVPHSGQCPDNHQVKYISRNRTSIAAERNIYILSKPRSKRNMPPSPKFRCAFRYIRMVKIFLKFKSEHFSEADRHIRISAEVKIYLERIRKYADPCS